MPASRTADPSPGSGDDLLSSRALSKKKRIPGACDICKRKKIRCDSGEMPGNRCSNCIQYGFECTHREVTKTLGSAKGYVESLEARLEKMDKLLAKILPGIDVNTLEVDEDITTPLPRNDDDDEFELLASRMLKLQLNPPKNRFFGKSSGLQLVQTALDLRDEYISGKTKVGGEDEKGDPSRPPWGAKRREFWEVPSWAMPSPEHPPSPYTFPPPDLIMSLIEAYFAHINPFIPLLHRPTFLRQFAEKQHILDQEFGAIVLLVCALGARYSDDSRVFIEDSENTLSAGWKWYNQVKLHKETQIERTSLHELQMCALAVHFAQGTEVPHGIWTQIGTGLRRAQEVGAHRRRKSADGKPSAEDELWKRAFWVILSFDRLISTFSGRPCGLQEEDFDLDLPIECDDEYWDHDFQQPAGKPSSMAFFNCYLSLMDILAYATRVIYPIRRPKNLFGKAIHRTDQQIIAEMDSAMNNWMDSIPDHLRWNSSCTNELILKQSAALYATYYNIQIFIHRPFIPSPRNPHPVSFPSLAICTNAARSCCHVLESYSRLGALPLPHLQITAFQSAVILLLNIWGGKKSGMAPNPRREMEDVQKCMKMLKDSEERWSSAGRFWDILAELAFAGALAIPTGPSSSSGPTISKPTGVPAEDPDSASPATTASIPTPPSTSHVPSELKETEPVGNPAMSFSMPPPEETMNFSLPMYSTELGRLPIFGQFSFIDSMNTPSVNNHAHIAGTGSSVPVTTNTSSASTSPAMNSFTFPTQPPQGMSFNVAPRNLFTVADAYVKDALFNNQMSSNDRGMFYSAQAAQPPPVDLSSIFTAAPDFGDLSQFCATQAMNTDAPAPGAARANANTSGSGSMPHGSGVVGVSDSIWPTGGAEPVYTDLVDFDGFMGLLGTPEERAAAGITGFYDNRPRGGHYDGFA
ncbi:fungal-specific transcription factor domain-containing protein [Cyathus striatus]|nr:fungal-specific transcription factor domain-containing protein [Cyathus striatus]